MDRNRYVTIDDGMGNTAGKVNVPQFNPAKPTKNTPDPRKKTTAPTGGAAGYQGVKARSADELAALYGVMNDRDDIYNTLNQATEAKYRMWEQQTRALRDQQLTDYASQVSQMQNMQRQARQSSLRSGLSRGVSGAQEVLSQFYTQQQGNENQQYYQQQMGDIAAQKAGQKGADIYNAMAMSNELGMGLGNISTNQQTNEVQNRGNYLNYLGMHENAQATRYSADQSYNSYQSQVGKNLFDYAKQVGLSDDDAVKIAAGEMTFSEAIRKRDAAKKKPASPQQRLVGTPDPYMNDNTADFWDQKIRNGG